MGSPSPRDNTVISSIGTEKVIEIKKALRDCHALVHEHETGTFRSTERHSGSGVSGRAVSEAGCRSYEVLSYEVLSYDVLSYEGLSYEGLGVPEVSSGRLSMTLSTIPNSRAMSAVKNLSRSSASSMAL